MIDSEDSDQVIRENDTSPAQAHARPQPNGHCTALSHNSAIQESEYERLNDFATALNGWLWETDADLRFNYKSATIETITGLKPESYLGRTAEEIGCPDEIDPKEWTAYLDTLKQHKSFAGFAFPRRGSNGVRWLSISGVPRFSSDGTFLGYRGVASDVTAEREALDRETQLTSAITDLDETFALWDLEDRLILCNERYREFYAPIVEFLEPGVKFETLLRKAVDVGLMPEAEGREEEWIAERLHKHRFPSQPFEVQHQDGRWLLVREQALPHGAMISLSTDITARKRAERAFNEKNRMLLAAFRTMPDGICIVDADGNMVAWNYQLFDVMDMPPDPVVTSPDPGTTFLTYLAERGDFGEGEIDEIIAERRILAGTDEHQEVERQLPTGKWVECRSSPIEDGGYIAIYRDVTERKQAKERLQYLASVDTLTGIHNRRSFLEIAEAEFMRAERYDRALSFLLIDIDFFKSINDRFGHATGDTVLRQVVAACRSVLRRSDEIGRIGGEEFAILLPETGHESACIAAERLRWAVEKIVVPTGDVDTGVTVSVGIATATDKHASIEHLMADADAALYQAKRSGRNRSVHLSAA